MPDAEHQHSPAANSASRKRFQTLRNALRLSGRPTEFCRALTRRLLASRPGRAGLNWLFNSLPDSQIDRFVRLIGRPPSEARFDWKFVTPWKTIRVPVVPEHPRSWNVALSCRWQEPQVSRIYSLLLSQAQKCTFFDVGANYGFHSYRFLAAGAPCVLFEPQLECREYIRLVAERNGFAPLLCPKILSSAPGTKDFWTSVSTWFSSAEREFIGTREELIKTTVEATTLDSFCEESGLAPEILKVDVEGHEAELLHGARGTIEKHRPLIVMEICRPSGHRRQIFSQLHSLEYSVFGLLPKRAVRLSSESECEDFAADEFLFLPSGGFQWLSTRLDQEN